MKTLSVAVCTLEVDGKIPLIKFKRNFLRGYWASPGGKFEDDEFLPEAAEREMQEEIRHRVVFESFLAVVDELVIGDHETTRVILYVSRVRALEPVDQTPVELPEGKVGWFTWDEIAGMKSEIVPSDLRILQDIIFGGQTGYFKSQLRSRDGKVTMDLFERIGQATVRPDKASTTG